jgi:DNA-binding transcriptional LysR family regulator
LQTSSSSFLPNLDTIQLTLDYEVMDFSPLFAEHGLSLDRLRSFLKVVDAGGIAAATGSDPNRQSLFSRQIKELETFFGASLTQRKGRRLEITPDGERLARLIRSSFTDLSDFRADSQNEARRAIVAGGASVIEWLLTPALSDCRKALGNPLLETRSLRSAEITRALDDGQIDFGVLRSDAVPSSLKTVPIGKLDYALYIPQSLAPTRCPANPGQWTKLLSNLPQARLIIGSRFRRAVDEAHQTLLIRPTIVAETTSILQLAAIVKAGHAAAFLPQTADAALAGSPFVKFPLAHFLDHHRNLVLAYSQSHLSRRDWSQTQLSRIQALLKARLNPSAKLSS